MTRANRHSLSMVLLLVLTGNAMAQQSVVEHCRKTSGDADRIACLEAALLAREAPVDTDARVQVDSPSPKPESAPAVAVEPLPQTDPIGIGADQVIARTQTRVEILENLELAENLPVARYDKVPYERLVVTLENGQVWRQITGDTQRIRVHLKRNQTVTIEESSIGGYKLHLNEMRRTLRVERIR